jgi:beta-phosphoglucomutase-like phosphatase (HAD superfamily)
MMKGVLFGLDGVIADTLHDHFLAWNHMFENGEPAENPLLIR